MLVMAICRFRRDFVLGSRLSAFELAPRRILFFKLLMPYAGHRDFLISAGFGSWLTPVGSGVSA